MPVSLCRGDSFTLKALSCKKENPVYCPERLLGSGTFGVVYKARLYDTGECVAIKKVRQSSNHKSRELQILQELSHVNIVCLLNAFYSLGASSESIYLNLVMEFLPETLSSAIYHLVPRKGFTIATVRIYGYQIARGLAYLHTKNICHRDIKPQNVLLRLSDNVIKLCDFGSSKKMEADTPNVAYICSRFYRAPELHLGVCNYDVSIDMWSFACVLAETALGESLFKGCNGAEVLLSTAAVIGPPCEKDLEAMPVFRGLVDLPAACRPLSSLVEDCELQHLLGELLRFAPFRRPCAWAVCSHPFFDPLRDPVFLRRNRCPRPEHLFSFSPLERASFGSATCLIPPWFEGAATVVSL